MKMPHPPQGPPEASLPAFHLLAKPTGAACNLNCAYCYYLGKQALYPDDDSTMSPKVLEQYIRQLIESHSGHRVEVSWQGGEPTLMGLDFYRHAMDLVERYRRPGMTVTHTIQTNGTMLDDDWAAFFKKHDFLVGISLDGPRELHDTYRVDNADRPTFAAVMRGLRLLQKHGVEHNVLTTVNRANASHPMEVYRFLRDDAKATWIQFIPVVERIGEDGTPDPMGPRVSERSVQPDRFGRFLMEIYDEWVRRDVGRLFVQTFEATLRNWLNMSSSGMCVFNETCGGGPVLEHNGDLYSCDHFVDPQHRLGNIGEKHMASLLGSPQQVSFGLDKARLPSRCMECDVLFACRGECPKNRILPPGGEGPGVNYLCEGYKLFFHHTSFTMRLMAGLVRRGRPAQEVMQLLDQPLPGWNKVP